MINKTKDIAFAREKGYFETVKYDCYKCGATYTYHAFLRGNVYETLPCNWEELLPKKSRPFEAPNWAPKILRWPDEKERCPKCGSLMAIHENLPVADRVLLRTPVVMCTFCEYAREHDSEEAQEIKAERQKLLAKIEG